MKNIITQFSRLFVGVLFIISGLIKLNDPVGFSYKLAEYFSEPVFNMPFLEPLALGLAIFLVILEVVLGVMLLVGYKSKLTIWALLLLIVFFTFLTFYSAYFDVVKDCGCFGDALHLTPWQSFTKDIVLLFFILILFINKKLVKPLFSNVITNIITFASVVLCIIMAVWVLNHNPIKDFRPYKVGTNIEKGMEIPEGAPKSVVEMIFIYKVNGVDKEFTEKDLANIPTGATFVDRKDKVITEGYTPPIHDFTMTKDDSDYKEELLKEPKLLIFVTYDLALSNPDGMKKLEKLNVEAKAKGYKVIGMTASGAEEIAKAKKQYGLNVDFYFCDATALKTVERANPSIVVLHKGTVVQKVHYNDIDDLKLSDVAYGL
ncbi:DoxX family protein [Flavobacterium sp. ANB]|uniref:BT_3928 family protein n=1 Tax=unclassified Flavobacterium TaxID=196869 RepID=UPI0012B9C765|nr:MULTISPECIES: BT_3928 family protein [unclassified Flavobacterium]MBF4519312.1 DoxX family protein [Flavobacterium sp. ANB]MTD72255.1 DoxX family membrane protein [Flavobacterium sp. LC2016-13]